MALRWFVAREKPSVKRPPCGQTSSRRLTDYTGRLAHQPRAEPWPLNTSTCCHRHQPCNVPADGHANGEHDRVHPKSFLHPTPRDDAAAGPVNDRRASLKTLSPMLAADTPSCRSCNRVNRSHLWWSELPKDHHDSVDGQADCDEDDSRERVNTGNVSCKV